MATFPGFSNTLMQFNPGADVSLDQLVNAADIAQANGMDGINLNGALDNVGTGMSWDQIGSLGAKGLGALASLFQGFNGMNANKLMRQQLDMAKDQFNFAKDMSTKNYANSLKAFNNALQDRANNRAFMEGRSQASADEYYNNHKLTGA